MLWGTRVSGTVSDQELIASWVVSHLAATGR